MHVDNKLFIIKASFKDIYHLVYQVRQNKVAP